MRGLGVSVFVSAWAPPLPSNLAVGVSVFVVGLDPPLPRNFTMGVIVFVVRWASRFRIGSKLNTEPPSLKTSAAMSWVGGGVGGVWSGNGGVCLGCICMATRKQTLIVLAAWLLRQCIYSKIFLWV